MTRHAQVFAEAADPIGLRVGLGTQAVMDVDGGQGEAEGFPQRVEDVEESDRVGPARDGHQDGFAATEHPVAANGVLDADDETSGDGHTATARPNLIAGLS
jgi:hypothetical protein